MTTTHSVTFGGAHLVAESGVGGVYKYIINGTSGLAVHMEACWNELCLLIFSY